MKSEQVWMIYESYGSNYAISLYSKEEKAQHDFYDTIEYWEMTPSRIEHDGTKTIYWYGSDYIILEAKDIID